MIMAFIIWALGKMGVEATPQMFADYERAFRERGHHVMLDFGGTRFDGSRWTGDDFQKLPGVGLGYEYLVDRKYNGVGFEVLGQALGPWFRSGRHDFMVGGGLAYYPISPLRLAMAGGVNIVDTGKTDAFGRVGLGYRIPFFMLAVQPNVYFQSTSSGVFTWQLGARFEY